MGVPISAPDQSRSNEEVFEVRLDATWIAEPDGSATVGRSRRDGTGDNDQVQGGVRRQTLV
jgi:hypothetical protein